MVGTVALWMLLPLGVTVLGGLAAIRRPPGPRLTSGLQHFAAGIVIAAVCTEVVPEAIAKDHIWSVIVGFVIGVLTPPGCTLQTLMPSGPASSAAARVSPLTAHLVAE